MKEQQQHIHKKQIFRYSSSKKYLKVFVPDFAFKHDNDDEHGKDKFVGRDVQFRRLYTWLTSDSKSGSYLITGYRGMGKSLLVKRVIEVITREPKAYKEAVFLIVLGLLFCAGYWFFEFYLKSRCNLLPSIIMGLVAFGLAVGLFVSKKFNFLLFEKERHKLKNLHLFDKEFVSKFFVKRKDRRERQFGIMPITINLGQEVLHERDVLSLMAQNIYDKYNKYVYNKQNKPIFSFFVLGGCIVLACFFARGIFAPTIELLGKAVEENVNQCGNSFLGDLSRCVVDWFQKISNYKDSIWLSNFFFLMAYLGTLWLTVKIMKFIRKHIPYYSTPFKAIDRLKLLCERISSTINEDSGSLPKWNNGLVTLSLFGRGKKKTTPTANVREIEQELLSIINDINGDDCPKLYRAQFIIVFDELDKITKAASKSLNRDESNDKESTPDFDATLDGFTDAMAFEERKQNVLRLLANMKLFISSVKAKCVFISGHELFDASMADLSDREYAINSIFNGVLNVSSFLTPEKGEMDVSSMTELYVATMLIPEDYLVEKICHNSGKNNLLKEEQPSLRWYYEYLMDKHVRYNYGLSEEEARQRQDEIMYAIEFLRYFTVFLSHISNGSPKKIATYFEKYIMTNYDAMRQFDWHDEIVVGVPSEKDVRKQCVLYFNPNSQKLVNFIYYIASPVMNAITNEVSNYGDKLMVSSSFILDQIYKYHGKGFSWRNLEQMPELLTSNKNPELRDSMSSIVEFLLQVHIANISSGIFQYKFHKQISEEISTLSKISEEASAIFNFTLNETDTVKRYNTRLLNHYLSLAASKPNAYVYKDVLERLHENQGDIFFSEEDYYRSIHEYRSALQYFGKSQKSIADVLAHLRCSLKVGMAYEYRRTYENAFNMYCEIVNKLIHIHWVEEGDLGLDYTMRLTGDWRVKQTVLVDNETFENNWEYNRYPQFRREFNSGLWEDIKKEAWGGKPKYSIDADKTISGLSALYTPEKSEIFEKLTTIEEVKYVYQAIIAKLFIIEKMQVSGITQSSIEEAEAEFLTLYNDASLDEKFMIAADFFSKMAEILYYKNSYVIANQWGNLSSALYRFDINMLALLDDYCFWKRKNDAQSDVIQIKDDVRKFFAIAKLEDVGEVNMRLDRLDFGKLFLLETKDEDSVLRAKIKERWEKETTDGEKFKEFYDHVKDYLNYLNGHHVFKIDDRWSKIKDCYKKLYGAKNIGFKLPCNACKYVNRSMKILIENMFDKEKDDYEIDGKAVFLLRKTSHLHIKHLRQSQVALLASVTEQLANIMLSCSSTDVRREKHISDINSEISMEVIRLLENLSKNRIEENPRKTIIDNFCVELKKKGTQTGDSTHLYKLDKVLLYYWAAYRFYDIASMYKEASQCVERIVKVLEDYLIIINFDTIQTPQRIQLVKRLQNAAGAQYELIENLFRHAAIATGKQYDSFDTAEIHENKWLFHMERADDIDLAKLSVFPNLQSVFIAAVNCKLLCMRYLRKKEGADSHVETEYSDYLTKIYNRVAPPLRHEKTFKGEVESYYMKVRVNSLVLVEILKKDILRQEREACLTGRYEQHTEHHHAFYFCLKRYLSGNDTTLDKRIFKIDDSVQKKIDLLNYLVHDSMICLTNILKILTPHNHITTFSNSFLAGVYDMLWEWSKYYELLYDLYIYYRYSEEDNREKMDSVVRMSARNTLSQYGELNNLIRDCVALMKEGGVVCKDEFGYMYSKLLLSIRHEMDDATIHHMYTNYSADMAIKYYCAARDMNNEGLTYKDMISNMYVLNDDLRNDTCQYNLADERYLINSGYIFTKRRQLEKMYERTNTTKISSYEKSMEESGSESFFDQLTNQFADSVYMNTEY